MASMLMLSMLAAFSVGMIYLVQTSMQSQGTDLEGNQVFYGAAAAMEKMVVDLNTLYSGQQVVSVADVEALAGVGYRPALPGVNYSQYQIVVPNTFRSARRGISKHHGGTQSGFDGFRQSGDSERDRQRDHWWNGEHDAQRRVCNGSRVRVRGFFRL